MLTLRTDPSAPRKQKPMLKFWKRYLDPVDILTEAIYGVLIVMTFTMAVHAFNPTLAAHPEANDIVKNLFVAAIGCTLAWGLIDGVIHLLLSLAERNQSLRYVREIQAAESQRQAVDNVAAVLDKRLGQVTNAEDRERLSTSIVKNLAGRNFPEVWLERQDIWCALALFSVAVACTLPVVLPLLVVRDPFVALRLSNLISIGYLFLIGFWWARYAGAKTVRTGLLVALLGTLLALIAIPLGG